MNSITQPSLFDQANDQRPHPLLVAQKWGFKLSYIDQDGIPAHYLYHAVQWVMGLGATHRQSWTDLKKQLSDQGLQLNIYEMPYVAEDGKTYQVDFIDQDSCYLVSQNMRLTKDRPQLKEIQIHLANVMTWADEFRRDGEKREAISVIDRRREIEKLERAGYGDHPVTQHLRDRDENIKSLNTLKATISKACDEPKWRKLFNQEYISLFNETARELKVILNTKSIRDALPPEQLAALTLGERLLQRALAQQGKVTSEQIEIIIDQIMRPIGRTLREICESLNIHPITGQSLLE